MKQPVACKRPKFAVLSGWEGSHTRSQLLSDSTFIIYLNGWEIDKCAPCLVSELREVKHTEVVCPQEEAKTALLVSMYLQISMETKSVVSVNLGLGLAIYYGVFYVYEEKRFKQI